MIGRWMMVVAACGAALAACGGKSTTCASEMSASNDDCLFTPPSTGLPIGPDAGADEDGSSAPAPPAGPLPAVADAAATCTEPGTVVGVYDIAGIRAWITRTWFHCNGAYLFHVESAGIELASDGTWYFLDDTGGKLVRRAGFAGGGTWSLLDVSDMNGAGNAYSVQVNFDSYQGGGIGGFVHFATGPLKLEISAYPGESSEYLAVQP